MADVTISQLTKGIPVGNNVFPYSTGSNTLGVPVSAIFQNADKIGLATNNPSHQLHITANQEAPLNSSASGGTLFVDRPNRNYECSLNMGTSGIREWFFGLNNDANSGLGDTSDLLLYDWAGGVGNILKVKKGLKTIDLMGTKVINGQITGSVIQVKQGLKTNTQSFNTATFNDVSGLSVTITPKALGSSFLINVQLSVSTPSTQAPYIRIVRDDGTTVIPIGIGDVAGNRTRCNSIMYTTGAGNMVTVPINYLDTPTYNSLIPITYKVQIFANSGPSNGNVGVNYYSSGDGDVSTQPRASSTIIVQEIAG